jgi:hypothetical protein
MVQPGLSHARLTEFPPKRGTKKWHAKPLSTIDAVSLSRPVLATANWGGKIWLAAEVSLSLLKLMDGMAVKDLEGTYRHE